MHLKNFSPNPPSSVAPPFNGGATCPFCLFRDILVVNGVFERHGMFRGGASLVCFGSGVVYHSVIST